ncbi:hypothetical protein BT69DRAFT_1370723, partial [Atractiella rhizophila]
MQPRLLSSPRCLPLLLRSGRLRVRGIATAATTPENHDIVIVGGGPAGLSLASALVANPAITSSYVRKITLLDGADFEHIRSFPNPSRLGVGEYSNRVSSITADSKAFLEGFGGWDHVRRERAWPMKDMVVSDGVTDALIEFNSGNEPMATLVENLNLQRGLLSFLSGRENSGNVELEILDKTKVEDIVRDG